MLRIQQVHLALDEDVQEIPNKLIRKLKISREELLAWRIHKETFDARPRHMQFSYSIDVEVRDEEKLLRYPNRDIIQTPDERYQPPEKGMVGLTHRPIVVGFGPAGMFASLLLAQLGYRPLVLERGEQIDQRVHSVEQFWQEGVLNTESNVQFGEGGAGTFSDGKLTTRVKDSRIRKVLEELVAFGAPEDILYAAHPHIGTDLLRDIVKRLRMRIEELGGEIRFSTKLEDLHIEKGELCAITANQETLPCEQLILAIGHSARDTLRMLDKRGVAMEPKAFAVGARIEHPQKLINQAQYKEYANHPRLKAAEYRLTYPASNGRGVYTFCMCPGGYVVPSASMEGGVVVNGMSEHERDGENANSALLVQVRPQDYGNTIEGAIAYQEELERKAFVAGDSTYRAPAQLVGDFLRHRPSLKLGQVQPTYALQVTLTDLHEVLPTYVCEAMEEAIRGFDKKLHGFAQGDAILTGVETRSSSPVRMLREKEDCTSVQIKGLYPCGEGAGYAGGIVSAAIDGLRCAESIIQLYHYEP